MSPNEMTAAAGRLLAMQFYSALQQRVCGKEASAPFDPKHSYGKLDLNTGWSNLPPEQRQLWIDAATEIVQKQEQGRL